MSALKRNKINQLLSSVPKGVVLLTTWLKGKGYSPELVRRYRSSEWLKSIGLGANVRCNDEVSLFGGLFALQHQNNMEVHVGARSALSLLGKAHYLELDSKKITLFGSSKCSKLPKWFTEYSWETSIEFHTSGFLPSGVGLVDYPVKDFMIRISNEIRASMECQLLASHNQEFVECFELMQSMNNVHPKKVQELLEKCSSIKVKRIFLYMAEQIGHEWFNHLDISKIELGSGKRTIVKNGVLNKKYQITVLKSWSEYDRNNI